MSLIKDYCQGVVALRYTAAEQRAVLAAYVESFKSGSLPLEHLALLVPHLLVPLLKWVAAAGAVLLGATCMMLWRCWCRCLSGRWR
jgi:hypothetical protein